jgi:hypothetical protein
MHDRFTPPLSTRAAFNSLELPAEHFRHDTRHPDLRQPRGAEFVLIEVLWSDGRSVQVKRKFLAALLKQLGAAPGLDPRTGHGRVQGNRLGKLVARWRAAAAHRRDGGVRKGKGRSLVRPF